MAMNLGSLVLDFAGDTTDLERSFREMRRQAQSVARDIDKAINGVNGKGIKVKLDLSEFKRLNSDFTIKAKFDTSELKKTSVKIKCDCDFESKQINRANNSSNVSTAVSKAASRIVKAIKEGEKIKLGEELTRGFLRGVGETFSGGLANSKIGQRINRGQVSIIDKTTDYASRKAGAAWHTFVNDSELQKSGKAIQGILGNSMRKAGYRLGDGIVAAIEDTSGSVTSRFKSFFKEAINPSEISQSLQGAGKALFKEVKKGSNHVVNEIVLAQKNFEKITAPIGQGLSARREKSIEERALPLVRQRALEILEQKRTKNSAKLVNENTKELFVATGGYAGARGLSGDRIAKDIKKRNIEGAEAIWVRNNDTDIDASVLGTVFPKAGALAGSLAKPHLRGYSKDAVEMASQGLAALERNPTIKVKFLGESGGGFAAEEAQKIMEMLGYGDRSTYLSVGTPNLIGRLNTQKGKKIISPDDYLGQEAEVYARYGLAQKPDYNLLGVEGHPIEHYNEKQFAELENFYKGRPQELGQEDISSIRQAANAFKSTDISTLDSRQLADMSKQAFHNWQLLRQHLLGGTSELTDEIAEIANEFKQVYLKTGRQSADVASANQILERVEQLYNEIEANPGTQAYNTAQQLLKELEPYQKEIKS
ncbi:MAG: hypothetical protein F6K31_12965, partial [Symploca sp. SIO2G7]|nr:hypothetical protein [Symploca sp. SIO2G7]